VAVEAVSQGSASVSGIPLFAPETAAEVVRTVRRQQGLYQIFKDCCDSHALQCDECVLVRAME